MKPGSKDDMFDKEPLGRIPESLIDAALDGEICDQMQEEIAHALQYDHGRRAELLETADAVRALDLDDIPMPDMQCVVLNRLDQHERFIPRAMRRWVRTGRLAIAAGVLLGLMMVAGLQSMYPRLTTLGAQSTPVDDVASAMAEDSQRMVVGVQDQVEHVRASISPLEGFFAPALPSVTQSYTLTVNRQVVRLSEADLLALYESGVGERFPERVQHLPQTRGMSRGMTLVSFVGGEGRLLTNSESEGFVVIHADRVDLETTSDDCIADLP